MRSFPLWKEESFVEVNAAQERTPPLETLAHIHLAGREDHSDIDVPEQKSWNREEFLEKAATIEECISLLPELSEYDLLALRSIEFKQELARVNPIHPDMLGLKNDHLIHGDYHGRNIFYNADDEVSHVFDFEKTCRVHARLKLHAHWTSCASLLITTKRALRLLNTFCVPTAKLIPSRKTNWRKAS